MEKRLLFSVTKADLRMDTFTVPGPGGGGKDTSRTGVRFTHLASGAVGEGREERSQNQNKKAAFEKMAASPKFKAWVNMEVARRRGEVLEAPGQIMERVDRMIARGIEDGSIVVEEL